MSPADWATKAADEILRQHGALFPHITSMNVASIITTHAEPLVALLRESKQEHLHVDDAFYCCPKCTCINTRYEKDGNTEIVEVRAPNGPGLCTCGADAYNAKVDAVLGEVKA
jgi:hypothetical protein